MQSNQSNTPAAPILRRVCNCYSHCCYDFAKAWNNRQYRAPITHPRVDAHRRATVRPVHHDGHPHGHRPGLCFGPKRARGTSPPPPAPLEGRVPHWLAQPAAARCRMPPPPFPRPASPGHQHNLYGFYQSVGAHAGLLARHNSTPGAGLPDPRRSPLRRPRARKAEGTGRKGPRDRRLCDNGSRHWDFSCNDLRVRGVFLRPAHRYRCVDGSDAFLVIMLLPLVFSLWCRCEGGILLGWTHDDGIPCLNRRFGGVATKIYAFFLWRRRLVPFPPQAL